MTALQPSYHRFPMSVVGDAIWLDHRFTSRNVHELLLERGIQVSPEARREWCIKCVPLLTEELRQREGTPGSRWFLDEVCVKVGGVTHWLWRAIDEHGAVLDSFLYAQRGSHAAKWFLTRLLGEDDVPEARQTNQLRSDGAAMRELQVLRVVEHQEVACTARGNNLVEQSHRPTRRQKRSQLGFRPWERAQEFVNLQARITNLDQPTRTTVLAHTRRRHQKQAVQTWRKVAAGVA